MSVSLNNSNNPVNREQEWISVETQEKRFRIHKAADVFLGLGNEYVKHERFDAQIAGMIAEYAVDDNWSKACRLLGQKKVLAFPEEHISEVGGSDSVFYFIPAGSLNQFEARLKPFALEVLGIQGDHPLKFRYFEPIARQEHGDSPHDAKWALMQKNRFLEGSRGKSYEEQEVLAAKKGISIPSIQTVSKILFLDKVVQLAEDIKHDLEAVKSEKTVSPMETYLRGVYTVLPIGTYTRAIQTIYGRHLSIGGVRPSGVSVHFSDLWYGPDIGLAVLREF